MFERISNGWELAQGSWSVLKLDKELLLFPIMSGVSCLIVLASFLGPVFLNLELIEAWMEKDDPAVRAAIWVGLFLFYFCNYFVIVFFNSALVACAIIRFRGGDPTVSDGIQAALSRLPQILAWSLVSATAGVLLKVIENQSEKFGEFVAGILGGAWTIVTYFVVPVLVVERANPVEAVKRSFQVITRTWGESLVAGFSIGTIAFLFSLPAIALIVVGGFVAGNGQLAVGVVLSGLGLLGLVLVNLISTTLDTILLGALYLYSADGQIPEQFDRGALRGAFQRH